MPRLEFQRSDTMLVIAPHAHEAAMVVITPQGRAPMNVGVGPLPEVLRLALVTRPAEPEGATAALLMRLVLDIRSPELQAFPWEQWLVPSAEQHLFDAVLRSTRVPARVSQATFTPPLRLLVCDVAEPERLLEEVRSVFGARAPERDARVAQAFSGASVAAADLAVAGAIPQGWPVVDVLHLGRLPLLEEPLRQLSSDPTERGSLGWLARTLHAWQTRLLVLDVYGPGEAALARRLAAALVACAGPAVIVRDAGAPTLPLYDRLIHDMPLDALVSRYQYTGLPLPRLESLYGGGGREELVRVSAAARALSELNKALMRSRVRFRRPPGRAGGGGLAVSLPGLVRGLDNDVHAATVLKRLVKDYDGWAFNVSESDGFIPLSESIAEVRDAARGVLRASSTRNRRRKPRHVNALLCKPGADRVDPSYELLQVGSDYELRLQIGPRDRQVPVYETSAFKEIPRIPGQAGAWLEVAVNGLGFEVDGASVQQLWLSFDEPSDELRFAVRPTRVGAAVLRYTLHYRQNVVQSFRLVALTRTAESDDFDIDAATRRQRLAAALHVPMKRLPPVTWLVKLDYVVASIQQAGLLPERRLAIVANHTLDERWVTVKGKDYQFEGKPGGVNPLVTAARDQLFEGSMKDVGTPPQKALVYRFGANLEVNANNLQDVLPKIALAGWQMYDSVFSRRARSGMNDDLATPGAMITVAHALLNEVVPWAVMYDRPLFPAPPGERLKVCMAALPAADGSLPVQACGQSAQCLLQQGCTEAQVVCPLHFWGFRHQIEIPPRQVDGLRAAAPSPAPPSAAAAPATAATAATALAGPASPRLCAVLNAALHTTPSHQQSLLQMKTLKGKAVVWQHIELVPGALLQVLQDPGLDLVYLYCHARGGVGDPAKTSPPLLEFSDGKKLANSICTYTADRFQFVWNNRPLVIVNGCSTAVFTPDALSPFVQKFYRDCEAGGVIGTEIPVHEWLATDFAQRMLARVLDGEPVGAALLAVRRELLAQANPLGLAYTFFGFSEMAVGNSL